MMMIAMLSFVANDAMMKYVFQEISVEQGILIRGSIAVPILILIAYFRKSLFVNIDRRNWRAILIRAIAEMVSTITFLTALSHMPLANITAILQSLPLTVTMFAALFLGETVRWRRWAAIIIGFCGVLIIIRPSGEGFDSYAILALVTVMIITIRDVVTRKIDKSVPSLFVALISAIPVCFYAGGMTVYNGWTPLGDTTWLAMGGAALAITSGYLFAVMAMRNGDISFVTPFRYTGMVWAILFGFLLFGNLPDQTTVLGTLIVVGMGVYSFHRERINQKKANKDKAGANS